MFKVIVINNLSTLDNKAKSFALLMAARKATKAKENAIKVVDNFTILENLCISENINSLPPTKDIKAKQVLRSQLRSKDIKMKSVFSNLTTGKIESIQDNVILASGLLRAYVGELVNVNDRTDTTTQGFIMNIETHQVKIVLLKGDQRKLSAGNRLYRTYKLPSTRSGFGILGQIITPLGLLLSNSDFSKSDIFRVSVYATVTVPVMTVSPGIIDRDPVSRPFMTGITAIDCFLPIGCGQRELIIGDKNTGKTSLAVTALLNQRSLNLLKYSTWRSFETHTSFIRKDIYADFTPCIYVFIGKRRSEGVRLKNVFTRHDSMKYTSFVFTSSDDLAALQYLAPYSGSAMGEWFRDRSYHCAIVYDDLSEHAVAYRQISLLLRRPPGREAYPGDIFYIHSRLLERSAQLSMTKGGGSLTALPIVETKGGDISGYIPTNVISITDGQVFLSTKLFNEGFRPAINLGLSVSRVGSNAQYDAMKDVSKKIKSDYSMYKAYASLAKVSSDIDAHLVQYINRGTKLNFFFIQDLYETMSFGRQVMALYAFGKGYADLVNNQFIRLFFKLFFKGFFISEYIESSTVFSFSDVSRYTSEDLTDLESGLIINSLAPYEQEFNILFLQYQRFFLASVQPKLLDDKEHFFKNSLR